MRVAIVTPSFPPNIGGIETHVEQLAIGLSALGCDVHVLTHVDRGTPTRRHFHHNGITLHEFADWTGTKRFQIAPALALFLRQNRAWFDLVHAHSFGHSTALLASLGERGEFLFTPHYHGVGHTPLARFTHLGYDPLAKQIFKTASDIICVSEAEAVNLTRDYPICTNRTVVIPNGIDIESISSAAPFDCLEPVVLAIGRLEHYKQFDRIITAMSSVSIPAKLVIIGDGPARESLTRSVESLGLANRVQFLGRVATSELRRWQKTAHLVISMSRFEAFGLVLAEGAVAGCRVVASDTPAHREVAEQYGGPFEFVPIDIDAVELANVISRSLGLPRVCADPGKLISWSEMASRVLARYELALSDRETAGQQLGC